MIAMIIKDVSPSSQGISLLPMLTITSNICRFCFTDAEERDKAKNAVSEDEVASENDAKQTTESNPAGSTPASDGPTTEDKNAPATSSTQPASAAARVSEPHKIRPPVPGKPALPPVISSPPHSNLHQRGASASKSLDTSSKTVSPRDAALKGKD